MKNVIFLDTPHGVVQVESFENNNIYRGEDKKTIFHYNIDEVKKIIVSMGNSMSESIMEIINSPSEVEVELGLKFSGESGIIIAKTSLESSITIKLVWKKNNENKIDNI
jgi:hypothetical protein